jgi:uncharacterized protein
MPAPRMIFVNIAVKDLAASTAFFSALGFRFDPRITDESATGMIVNEGAYVMLLVDDRFREFTTKPLADPAAQTEAILAFSAESRQEVDRLVDAALAAGGTVANPPMNNDAMYIRSFNDIDGHLWEVAWMDAEAFGW